MPRCYEKRLDHGKKHPNRHQTAMDDDDSSDGRRERPSGVGLPFQVEPLKTNEHEHQKTEGGDGIEPAATGRGSRQMGC